MQQSTDDCFSPSDFEYFSLDYLGFLLGRVHPGCGYVPWFKALRAVHHETGGSEEGFELVDRWSKKGHNYRGRRDVRKHWRSIKPGVRPITAATLIWMARLMKKLYGAQK